MSRIKIRIEFFSLEMIKLSNRGPLERRVRDIVNAMYLRRSLEQAKGILSNSLVHNYAKGNLVIFKTFRGFT